jgi:hypothetical protein
VDKRKLPKLRPPQKIGKRPVTAYLGPQEYARLYDLCMKRNISAPELIRQMLKETEK